MPKIIFGQAKNGSTEERKKEKGFNCFCKETKEIHYREEKKEKR